MDIRSKIRIIVSFSAVLILGTGLVGILASGQASNEIRNMTLADKIAEGAYELNILTGDLHHADAEERARQRWQLTYESLGELLPGIEIKGEGTGQLLDKMSENHERIGDFFIELSSMSLSEERGEMLGQIEITSQLLVSDAFALVEESRTSAKAIWENATLIVIGFISIMGMATLGNVLFVSRQISRPIRKLTEEMEEVSLGHLESSIGRESDDELGRLILKVRNNLRRLLGERTKAIVDLKTSNELLEKSNEALESYSYAISHDLKAPVRSMQSFSSFLLEDYGDKLDATGLEYLKRITNSASRMDTLIESLLTLSRVGKDSSEIEAVDLNGILDEIITDLDIKGKVKVLDRLPTVQIQRTWIKQLFLNLIGNGLKFNKSKVPRIEIYYQERSEDHLFGVRDNGIGIERKYWKRIFELFQGLHGREQYEGVGAGLAISKKIVDEIGGRIWVESIAGEGEGSTFHFTIPKSP